MKTIYWMHNYCLREDWLKGPSVYVFDQEQLTQEQWSLKRVGFVYECLLEMPVSIRKGDPVREVVAFAAEHEADTVVTMATPDTRILQQISALRMRTKVQIIEPEPFVRVSDQVDLRRFSRYWQRVEPLIIR